MRVKGLRTRVSLHACPPSGRKCCLTMRKGLFILLLTFCTLHTVLAQWNLDPAVNTPISTGTEKMSSNPWITKDGNGGYYIASSQINTGVYGADIYLQHLDKDGRPLWRTNGIKVTNVANNEYWPKVINDAAGGVYVVWQDQRTGFADNNIYAQLYDPTGTAVWAPDGIPVTNTLASEMDPQIISDGAGGVIVCWWSSSDGGLQTDLFAQRLDRSGAKLWPVTSVSVCTAINRQENARMISDNSGGAIIAWRDHRNSATNTVSDVFAQRILGNGSLGWSIDGVPVSTAQYDQMDIQLTTDGSNGAIITWSDNRRATPTENIFDIYAQRINSAGTPVWTTDGRVVSAANGAQTWPMIVDDDEGGAIICFFDTRNGALGNAIYAQRMSADGMVLWPQDGIPASNYTNNISGGFIVKDGNHGAIVAWQQNRDPGDIYAQHLYANGISEMHITGYPVSTAPNSQIFNQGYGKYFQWVDNRHRGQYCGHCMDGPARQQ